MLCIFYIAQVEFMDMSNSKLLLTVPGRQMVICCYLIALSITAPLCPLCGGHTFVVLPLDRCVLGHSCTYHLLWASGSCIRGNNCLSLLVCGHLFAFSVWSNLAFCLLKHAPPNSCENPVWGQVDGD